MNRVDFVTLKLFVAIADEKSLTRAAEREHLALAAVSKRIRELERHLDTPVLYRQARGVELTPAGHALLHHAVKMMDGLRQLSADLAEYSEGIRGHVRVHANTSAVIEFLPEDLADFIGAHPHIKIDLEEGVSHEVIHAVREGLTDIGIFAGHVAAEGLQVLPYKSDHLVLVTPAGHALAQRASINLSATLGYDYIGLQQDTSLHSLIQQAAKELNAKLRFRIQVRSFEAICRMIHTGMGIGILPREAVKTYLPSMDVVAIPLNDPWAHRQLQICIRNYGMLPPIARQLVDHLTHGQPGTDSSLLTKTD